MYASLLKDLLLQLKESILIMNRKLTHIIQSRDLTVVQRKDLKPKPGADHQYTFGGISTDYMLEIDYDVHNGGWKSPIIKPN